MAEPQKPKLNIPLGYPRQLSDEQLTDTIDSIQTYIEQSGFNINDVMQLSPLLQTGANELQSRIADRQAQSSQRYADSSRRLAIVSVSIAVVALLVAVSTSLLSFRATHQDTLIQNEQLEVLKSLARPDQDATSNADPRN